MRRLSADDLLDDGPLEPAKPPNNPLEKLPSPILGSVCTGRPADMTPVSLGGAEGRGGGGGGGKAVSRRGDTKSEIRLGDLLPPTRSMEGRFDRRANLIIGCLGEVFDFGDECSSVIASKLTLRLASPLARGFSTPRRLPRPADA